MPAGAALGPSLLSKGALVRSGLFSARGGRAAPLFGKDSPTVSMKIFNTLDGIKEPFARLAVVGFALAGYWLLRDAA